MVQQVVKAAEGLLTAVKGVILACSATHWSNCLDEAAGFIMTNLSMLMDKQGQAQSYHWPCQQPAEHPSSHAASVLVPLQAPITRTVMSPRDDTMTHQLGADEPTWQCPSRLCSPPTGPPS